GRRVLRVVAEALVVAVGEGLAGDALTGGIPRTTAAGDEQRPVRAAAGQAARILLRLGVDLADRLPVGAIGLRRVLDAAELEQLVAAHARLVEADAGAEHPSVAVLDDDRGVVLGGGVNAGGSGR